MKSEESRSGVAALGEWMSASHGRRGTRSQESRVKERSSGRERAVNAVAASLRSEQSTEASSEERCSQASSQRRRAVNALVVAALVASLHESRSSLIGPRSEGVSPVSHHRTHSTPLRPSEHVYTYIYV